MKLCSIWPTTCIVVVVDVRSMRTSAVLFQARYSVVPLPCRCVDVAVEALKETVVGPVCCTRSGFARGQPQCPRASLVHSLTISQLTQRERARRVNTLCWPSKRACREISLSSRVPCKARSDPLLCFMCLRCCCSCCTALPAVFCVCV